MVATLNLAASKTDIAAKGALRSHGCSCGGQASESDVLLCPFHSLCAQMELLRRRGMLAPSAPLF
eukprot:2091509-Amphidinium_carterae.1